MKLIYIICASIFTLTVIILVIWLRHFMNKRRMTIWFTKASNKQSMEIENSSFSTPTVSCECIDELQSLETNIPHSLNFSEQENRKVDEAQGGHESNVPLEDEEFCPVLHIASVHDQITYNGEAIPQRPKSKTSQRDYNTHDKETYTADGQIREDKFMNDPDAVEEKMSNHS